MYTRGLCKNTKITFCLGSDVFYVLGSFFIGGKDACYKEAFLKHAKYADGVS